jgi:mannobiose 2-epimerase
VFGIYGFSEYYKASGNAAALDYARQIYRLLERHALDPANNGYVEALTQDWQATDQLSLSDVDLNEKKSMNTHLHLLEAYTNLYRVWPDATLRQRLKNSIDLMLDRILLSQTGHFGLFFDEEWNLKSETISFGHEIEGVWLIHDAVILLDEPDYQQRVEKIILKVAETVYHEALELGNGGQWLVNEEYASGKCDPGKVWWVQAEACVGFLAAYQLTKKSYFLEAVQQIWAFIQHKCVDKKHGEWFWYAPENGVVDDKPGKVNVWKGPYHNVRACIELLERLREVN